MSDDIDEQRAELEDAFFAQGDEDLIAELETAIAQGERKQEMVEMFGIADARVIDQLLALGLGDKTVAAISLAPLVQIAWADGQIQPTERKALLAAAEQEGLKEWTIAFKLFKGWLATPPTADLLATWKRYMRALVADLDPEQKEFVKQEFLGRAEQIAAAAGGIMLRIGSVSSAEQAVLDDLAAVFD